MKCNDGKIQYPLDFFRVTTSLKKSLKSLNIRQVLEILEKSLNCAIYCGYHHEVTGNHLLYHFPKVSVQQTAWPKEKDTTKEKDITGARKNEN